MPGREKYIDDYSELERALARGIYGRPVLKKEERMRFLGQLRERLIFVLPEAKVEKGEIPEKLRHALDDIRTSKMVVKGNTDIKAILKYERLAEEYGVKMVTVSNPEFKGNVGLVVVSNHAVDLPDERVFHSNASH